MVRFKDCRGQRKQRCNRGFATRRDAPEWERMRKIDRDATKRAALQTIIFGTAGMLAFGTGLSMVLAWKWRVPGIVIGCCGFAVKATLSISYERLLRRERQRTDEQIAALSGKSGTE